MQNKTARERGVLRRKTTQNRKFMFMLDYMKKHGSDKFISPTEVGLAYGFSIDRGGYDSSVASPVLLSLTEQGFLERNSRGHYRYLSITERSKNKKRSESPKPFSVAQALRPSSIIRNGVITIYAGKFGEGDLKLNKAEASQLYLELHKFIFSDPNDSILRAFVTNNS